MDYLLVDTSGRIFDNVTEDSMNRAMVTYSAMADMIIIVYDHKSMKNVRCANRIVNWLDRYSLKRTPVILWENVVCPRKDTIVDEESTTDETTFADHECEYFTELTTLLRSRVAMYSCDISQTLFRFLKCIMRQAIALSTKNDIEINEHSTNEVC